MATIEARVRATVERLRPAVQMEGGDLELVDVDAAAGVARVRLLGACSDCSDANESLAQGVERMILRAVPEIRAVERQKRDLEPACGH